MLTNVGNTTCSENWTIAVYKVLQSQIKICTWIHAPINLPRNYKVSTEMVEKSLVKVELGMPVQEIIIFEI